MNVYSLTEWYVTYWSYVVLILLNQRSLSIKVMQLVLFRWRQVILNAIFCIKMVLFHRSHEHMNICKLSTCDNLEEIFTRSTILHISYELNTLVRKVCKFQGESLSSLWSIICWKHHIALFSLYEFSLWVSHIKFLMRPYQHKIMSYHLFFL